ncbi:LIC10920 family plasminogen-binding lipoprotein [Leptospira sarikeiensis]|uniref:Lipoprotein n=1 Tax=Leptospira sarikeiensis TaxID=2484943 RepID=A0A4R9K5I7_9LEPT|nr:hypothetical protein [Leptospira sarikeiensis]TGL60547.1 hypothetical protein EHQ64_11985 [Leptospira sarikeiensis]
MAFSKPFFSKLIPACIGLIASAILLVSCNNNDVNKIDLTATGTDGSTFPIQGEIDKDKTSNCGTATPYSSSGTGTTTGTTTGSTGTTNNLFTINSRMYFTTGAYITLKFVYDATQNQGSVDAQQGFTYSGLPSLGIPAALANFGKIFWGGSGVPVDTATSNAQSLSYLTVSLDLVGKKVDSGSVGLALTQCNTTDFVKCTSSTSNSMCFTQDGINCFNVNSIAGTTVSIKGDINCTSNAIPAGSSTTTQ